MVGQHLIEWRERLLKEARGSARLEGREQGRQEGRQEGRQQGEVEGMRRLLLDLLKLRFGPLPLPVRRRVKAIESVVELRALAGKVLRASSLGEMGLS